MTALVTALCFLGYFLGYFLYARFLARRVFKLDPSAPTPAHELRDEIDYVPTRRAVLFGHHFASITGLAPMLGPAVAVIWAQAARARPREAPSRSGCFASTSPKWEKRCVCASSTTAIWLPGSPLR